MSGSVQGPGGLGGLVPPDEDIFVQIEKEILNQEFPSINASDEIVPVPSNDNLRKIEPLLQPENPFQGEFNWLKTREVSLEEIYSPEDPFLLRGITYAIALLSTLVSYVKYKFENKQEVNKNLIQEQISWIAQTTLEKLPESNETKKELFKRKIEAFKKYIASTEAMTEGEFQRILNSFLEEIKDDFTHAPSYANFQLALGKVRQEIESKLTTRTGLSRDELVPFLQQAKDSFIQQLSDYDKTYYNVEIENAFDSKLFPIKGSYTLEESRALLEKIYKNLLENVKKRALLKKEVHQKLDWITAQFDTTLSYSLHMPEADFQEFKAKFISRFASQLHSPEAKQFLTQIQEAKSKGEIESAFVQFHLEHAKDKETKKEAYSKILKNCENKENIDIPTLSWLAEDLNDQKMRALIMQYATSGLASYMYIDILEAIKDEATARLQLFNDVELLEKEFEGLPAQFYHFLHSKTLLQPSSWAKVFINKRKALEILHQQNTKSNSHLKAVLESLRTDIVLTDSSFLSIQHLNAKAEEILRKMPLEEEDRKVVENVLKAFQSEALLTEQSRIEEIMKDLFTQLEVS